MLMSPYLILCELGLLSWSVIWSGWKEGKITKADVSNYAEHLMSNGLDDGDEDVAVLGFAESMESDEIEGPMRKLASVELDYDVREKWRLVALTLLNASSLSEEEKIRRLQEIYAEFDYPEDMRSCSIYSGDTVDPLEAMSTVISTLKHKLGII